VQREQRHLREGEGLLKVRAHQREGPVLNVVLYASGDVLVFGVLVAQSALPEAKQLAIAVDEEGALLAGLDARYLWERDAVNVVNQRVERVACLLVVQS